MLNAYRVTAAISTLTLAVGAVSAQFPSYTTMTGGRVAIDGNRFIVAPGYLPYVERRAQIYERIGTTGWDFQFVGYVPTCCSDHSLITQESQVAAGNGEFIVVQSEYLDRLTSSDTATNRIYQIHPNLTFTQISNCFVSVPPNAQRDANCGISAAVDGANLLSAYPFANRIDILGPQAASIPLGATTIALDGDWLVAANDFTAQPYTAHLLVRSPLAPYWQETAEIPNVAAPLGISGRTLAIVGTTDVQVHVYQRNGNQWVPLVTLPGFVRAISIAEPLMLVDEKIYRRCGTDWEYVASLGAPDTTYYNALSGTTALWAPGRFTTEAHAVAFDLSSLKTWADIVSQPAAHSAMAGSITSFTVDAIGGALNDYQWRKDGVALSDSAHISGATTSTLTIHGVRAADAGFYDVLVDNHDCAALSNDAELTVTPSPDLGQTVLLASNKNNGSVLEFGLAGGAPLRTLIPAGQNGLTYPNGIAIEASGDVYVADVTGNRVQRVDGLSGQVETTYSDAQLAAPVGVALRGRDKLWVSSYSNNCVVEFDRRTGVSHGCFVAPGASGLSGADALLVTPSGNLLVSSQNTNQVLEFNGTTGAFVRVAASGGGLNSPAGLLLNGDGSLLVASLGSNQVLRYDTNGNFAGMFVAAGNGLSAPQGLARDASGNVLVASRFGGAILKYDGTSGAFLGSFGSVAEPTYLSTGIVNPDCDADGTSDSLQIADNPALDATNDGVLDACQCMGEATGDNMINISDLGVVLAAYGTSCEQASYTADADFDNNCTINLSDLGVVLSTFGQTCP